MIFDALFATQKKTFLPAASRKLKTIILFRNAASLFPFYQFRSDGSVL